MTMGREELELYMERQHGLYQRVHGVKARQRFIDKVVEATGYDRKRAIRLLNRKGEVFRQRGAARKLKAADVDFLRELWALADYPNARYFHIMLPRFLKDIRALDPRVGRRQEQRLLEVSYKTIERELGIYRVKERKKPDGMALRAAILAQVELVAPLRKVDSPGYICVDTVAHGGDTTAGDFAWTLTWTDIHTGFTINRALWNKGYAAMQEAFDYCVAHTPFPIREINSDNGTEFLNFHMLRYWADKGVKLTHSRPYHKNDNAHAEQKNRTHVRELFLNIRVDREEFVEKMNRIYEVANTIRNYIMPCMVLTGREYIKERHRSRRIYDKPRTPLARIIESGVLETAEAERLLADERRHNSIELFVEVERRLNAFFHALTKDLKEQLSNT